MSDWGRFSIGKRFRERLKGLAGGFGNSNRELAARHFMAIADLWLGLSQKLIRKRTRRVWYGPAFRETTVNLIKPELYNSTAADIVSSLDTLADLIDAMLNPPRQAELGRVEPPESPKDRSPPSKRLSNSLPSDSVTCSTSMSTCIGWKSWWHYDLLHCA